jgi:hypothetical protein
MTIFHAAAGRSGQRSSQRPKEIIAGGSAHALPQPSAEGDDQKAAIRLAGSELAGNRNSMMFRATQYPTSAAFNFRWRLSAGSWQQDSRQIGTNLADQAVPFWSQAVGCQDKGRH